MRVIGRAVMVAALLATMSGAPADALLVSQCGGTYSRTTSCMFTAAGPNLYVSGSTTASAIEVRVSDPSGNVVIFRCVGQSSCNAVTGIPATGTDSVGPPQGVGPLLCTVITTGSGFYRCESAT